VIPAVSESKLRNGLTVSSVQKGGVPIVTVQMLFRAGADREPMAKAGLADMTASMLTKGTTSRSAEKIAEEIEFLGGSLDAGASWNSSSVTVSVTTDKLDKALAIFADVIRNPIFSNEELELLRSQVIDELTYNLTQPGFLAGYAASVFSFREHPSSGTPESLEGITREDIAAFYRSHFRPENAVLIFGGDISAANAAAAATKFFGTWKPVVAQNASSHPERKKGEAVRDRILVVDLPGSGQAAVSYALPVALGRVGKGGSLADYYAASTLNSVLGGGYSSRLNQEIRIKRGLSYGAGSSFGWRPSTGTFTARTQTKNESAAVVAELVIAEIKRLAEGEIGKDELEPRKSVLTGGFGRNIETTGGLVNALGDLYTFGIPTAELNRYMSGIESVTDKQIRDLAKANLLGGDLIIVGDYKEFGDDLAKRFPAAKITVIAASDLDINEPGLKRTAKP
jgi:zinc protease